MSIHIDRRVHDIRESCTLLTEPENAGGLAFINGQRHTLQKQQIDLKKAFYRLRDETMPTNNEATPMCKNLMAMFANAGLPLSSSDKKTLRWTRDEMDGQIQRPDMIIRRRNEKLEAWGKLPRGAWKGDEGKFPKKTGRHVEYRPTPPEIKGTGKQVGACKVHGYPHHAFDGNDMSDELRSGQECLIYRDWSKVKKDKRRMEIRKEQKAERKIEHEKRKKAEGRGEGVA